MKVTNIFTLIEEFRNGRDIWTRSHIELAVREIRRLDKENQKLQLRLSANENDKLVLELSEMLKKSQAYVQKLEQQIPELNLSLAKANLKIAELEQERRWIPVSERLPEEDGYYDVVFQIPFTNKKYMTDTYYFIVNSKYKWFTKPNGWMIALHFDTVFYWKPRLQPPQEEE